MRPSDDLSGKFVDLRNVISGELDAMSFVESVSPLSRNTIARTNFSLRDKNAKDPHREVKVLTNSHLHELREKGTHALMRCVRN